MAFNSNIYDIISRVSETKHVYMIMAMFSCVVQVYLSTGFEKISEYIK